MIKTFYSINEVSEIFGVTKPTVYRWVKNGIFRHVRVGGTVRIFADDVNVKIKITN